MKRLALSICGALALAASPAAAVTITFDDLPAGTDLFDQYESQGVNFFLSSPLVASGIPSPSSQGWASNTGLTLAAADGIDVGDVGIPSLVSGNLLHSLQNWNEADGDPNFWIVFTDPVASVSLDFAGVFGRGHTAIYLLNGLTIFGGITTTTANSPEQQRLSYAGGPITSIIVAPGSYNNWVGVDNLTFDFVVPTVPEPATWAQMIGGFALLGLAMRRRRTAVRVTQAAL